MGTDLVLCEVQTEEIGVRSRASPDVIRGGQRGIVTDLICSDLFCAVSVIPLMLHTLVHLSTFLYQNKREKTGKLQSKQYSFEYFRSIAKRSTFTLLLFFEVSGYVGPATPDSRIAV